PRRSSDLSDTQEILILPISSLYGENLTSKSEKMPWYTGRPLLEILETMDVHKSEAQLPSRFPIQYVIRPRTNEFHDYRGYAGRVASGRFSVGDKVTVLPSGQKSVIRKIDRFTQSLETAETRQSVTLVLEDDIDVSRGDLIVRDDEMPELRREFTSRICWLDRDPMVPGKSYLLQHGTAYTTAKRSTIDFLEAPATLPTVPGATIAMNGIAQVQVRTAKGLPVDHSHANPANGAFILIDEHS